MKSIRLIVKPLSIDFTKFCKFFNFRCAFFELYDDVNSFETFNLLL